MKDILVRGSSADGSVRLFTTITTGLVNDAQKIHHTYPVATAALGRTLSAAAMIGASLKNETDTTTLQFNGDGPLGSITAVTDSLSRVRGCVANPYVHLPLSEKGKLDVGRAVGKGTLSVMRDLGMKEPYIGRVPIFSGEIAEDLTYYFAASEQIPTAVSLGVLVDTDNSVLASGGIFLQLMPGADDSTAELLEKSLAALPPVTKMISGGMSAEDIFFAASNGVDMLMENKTVTPRYECPCSKERMERAVISLGREEIRNIIDEDGHAELSCRFCDNKYDFSKEELEKMLENS
ncbi:MAG: Hsp33 family molecular chaperone HslO [Oscillospiraceae bacterium]|nr:Hsp33 family molecular chaperone HslO [Oscillospiraceae bacterium]